MRRQKAGAVGTAEWRHTGRRAATEVTAGMDALQKTHGSQTRGGHPASTAPGKTIPVAPRRGRHSSYTCSSRRNIQPGALKTAHTPACLPSLHCDGRHAGSSDIDSIRRARSLSGPGMTGPLSGQTGCCAGSRKHLIVGVLPIPRASTSDTAPSEGCVAYLRTPRENSAGYECITPRRGCQYLLSLSFSPTAELP